jgi:hypothetical protein
MAQIVGRLLEDSANARAQGVLGTVADFSAGALGFVAEEEFEGGNWLVTNGGTRSR